MSSILKILAIAGLAIVAVSTSAQARPFHEWNHGQRWEHAYRGEHARWYGGGYYGPRYYGYGPRYYVAPPFVAYPPAYYGPPSINFNIPLG